jgi:hypothetical protein
LHAYAETLSVEAGDAISIHVSSTVPYDFSVRQLGADPDDASTDAVLHASAGHPAVPQPIQPGSCVLVERGLQAPLDEFTLECWLRPWQFGALQTVMSQSDLPCDPGIALRIDATGRPEFLCGDGEGSAQILTAATALAPNWAHLVATFCRGHMVIYVNSMLAAQGTGPKRCVPAPAPIRLGAGGWSGVTDDFLDGDISMPCIHAACLSADAVRARYAGGAQHLPDAGTALACWPLDAQRGDIVRDHSGHSRDGRIINHATWMVPGPHFDATKVPRFTNGPAYSPGEDPDRGHALRLASDDLVDCGWHPIHRITIPADAKSGLYVARFDFVLDEEAISYESTFVVRRARGRAAAPIAVLCASNTWLAYSSSPFARNMPGPPVWPRRGVGLPNSHPDAPDYNTYTQHRGGQPCYYTGLRMPRPNASPRALYEPAGCGFAQWVRLEREAHVWLDQCGYDYDVYCDLDLHKDPALLRPYRTVLINGHSEYWSSPALEGLDAYLAGGGTAIVLSGNTMYWRVSFNEDGSVMEQRKTETPLHEDEAGGGRHAAPGGVHGEQYHSQDGARGGLWRYNDRSCSDVIGLETAGWAFAEAADFGVYRVKQPDHFLFTTPLKTGLPAGATFGQGPAGALPRAVGHEWDITISTLLSRTGTAPRDAVLPRPQDGIVVLAEGVRRVPGEMDSYLDFFERAVEAPDGVSAEMIYWERPQGGRVFNAGSVASSWVLRVDDAFAALVANALAHFGIPIPSTVLPQIGSVAIRDARWTEGRRDGRDQTANE